MKTEPHPKDWMSAPPTTGPIMAPAEKAEIHMLTAKVRSDGSRNMLVMSDSVEGASVAPATPSAARARMSVCADLEKAATTDTAPKAAAPSSNTLRRPIRSPSPPMIIRKPATMNP